LRDRALQVRLPAHPKLPLQLPHLGEMTVMHHDWLLVAGKS
jgi:hypothetical protein